MQSYGKITVLGFLVIFLTVSYTLSQTSDVAAWDKPTPTNKPQDIQLIVTPSEVTLNVREQLQFKAEISVDNSISMSKIKIEWRVLGNIGSISSSGLFTASYKPGRGMISASAVFDKKPLAGYAVVKIAEDASSASSLKVIAVTVKPGEVSLLPRESQQFTTEPVGKTQWRVIPSSLGSITDTGLFTAGSNSGKGMVVATVQTTDGTGTGKVYVVVGKNNSIPSGPILRINISPKTSKVEKGDSVAFSAKIAGSNDNYPLEWDVYPKSLGHIEGTGYKVLFVAGTKSEGRALITAQVRTATEIGIDWATVDIGDAERLLSEKVKINISPSNASLKVGETMKFTANTSDKSGTADSWSVAPVRIGTINQNGIFTATRPGWGLVICKIKSAKGIGLGKARVYVGDGVEGSGLDDLAQASAKTINKVGKEKLGVSISGPQILRLSDAKEYRAMVTNQRGQSIEPNIAKYEWRVVPTNLGKLTVSGDKVTFVPNIRGRGVIIVDVKYPEVTGTGRISIKIE